MPRYSNTPPNPADGVALPILRTPASGKIKAIVTSDDLIGTFTHFWGGHTVPCTSPECDACKHGIPSRWHAYLSAWNPPKALHFLYECTAGAAQVLVDYRNTHEQLRSCVFEAYRWRNARNGRVMLRCEPHPDQRHPLPPAPNLEHVLSILWQLPKDNVKPTDDRYLGREIDVNPKLPTLREALNRQENPHAKPN